MQKLRWAALTLMIFVCFSAYGRTFAQDGNGDFILAGEFNDDFYYLSNEKANWNEAKGLAESFGGYLVVISSAEENAFVQEIIQEFSINVELGEEGRTWIGYTDQETEGNWTWVTNEEANYTNWGSGEPNNSGGEDFGEILGKNGKWNDIPLNGWGNQGYRFVIEVAENALSIEPDPIDFGTVTVGEASEKTIMIGNVSSADLNVINITSDLDIILGISETSFTVAPTATHDITLTLTADITGQINGTLTITRNDPNCPTKIVNITANASIPQTIYVSTTGNNSNDGLSFETAKRTIQAGINAAEDGDTVLVADGTYTGDGNKDIDFKGKAITVTSENGAGNCVIDCEGDGRGFYFSSGECQSSVVSGFTIKNGSADGGGIRCSNSSPTIRENIITRNNGTNGGGIRCETGSSPTIENNIITKNTSQQSGSGIFCHRSCSPVIQNNIITENIGGHWGGGICCDIQSSPQIHNNLIADNETRDGGGIACRETSSPSIINNTIVGNSASNTGDGITCVLSSFPTVINTIFWENGIFLDGDSSITITYSNVQGGWVGEGNIDEDPLFVDPEGGDYHLQTDSQCIDTGTANGAPSEDIEGNPRPHGDGIDMGAYEFQGLVPPKPSIVVSPDSIDLGDVIVGRQYVVTFGIGNDGDADLNVTNITHDLGDDLMIDPNPPYEPPLTVAPDDTTTVTLTFTVSVEGEISGTLSIESNDQTSPTEINISAIVKILLGDLSGDGSISAYDASLILQFVVGLITDFPIESMMTSSPYDIEPRNYEISIPDVSIKSGERIYVPVVVNDAKGLQAGGIVVKYDSTVLKAVDAMPTSTLTGGSYVECNTELEGEIRFAFASMKPIESGKELLMLEFSALQNIEGATSTLSLDHVKLSGSLSIIKKNGSITVLPSQSLLLQNYPNPFNPETWIPFQLAEPVNVVISIYDISGQIVRKIGLGEMPAGVYISKDKAVYWNGCNDAGEKVSSGVYFYTLQAGEYIHNFRRWRVDSATKRMLILK